MLLRVPLLRVPLLRVPLLRVPLLRVPLLSLQLYLVWLWLLLVQANLWKNQFPERERPEPKTLDWMILHQIFIPLTSAPYVRMGHSSRSGGWDTHPEVGGRVAREATLMAAFLFWPVTSFLPAVAASPGPNLLLAGF